MSQPPCGEQQPGAGPVTVSACAEASATEEADAGILHVGSVRGAPGNRRPYRGDKDRIHVWRAALDNAADLRGLLSADELARAARFHFERDSARFIAMRGVLRSILGIYTSVPPVQLKFRYAARGKPSLADNPRDVRFNLSHSHDLALIAVALGCELGVDVEYIKDSTAGPEIAERFFSRAEVVALRALPKALRRDAFFAGWTRKEAYIKATGMGLFAELDRFTVSLAPDEPAALLRVAGAAAEASRWSLFELNPGEGYAGALAVEGRDVQISCWHW